MRQLAIQALDAYRRAHTTWLKLRGQTPADAAAAAVSSGRAWEEFCDTLKAAGASLHFPGTPQDAFNQAEGYRYLTRLARAGLEAFIEYADPTAPVLRRMVHETVKMGADNPDNYYQNCVIDGAYDYVIEGQRGSVAYLSLATKAGHYGQNGGMPPVAELDASQLAVDSDGRFRISLSRQPQAGAWLKLPDGPGLLIVRQTFLDRASEVIAELNIRRVGQPLPPKALTPSDLQTGLRSAGTLVAGASLLFAKWANDFQKKPNQLPQFDPEVSLKAGGDPNIAYYHGFWRLENDQALVIDAMPPACEYWNFQLNNYWMESLDYRFERIHLNKHSAVYNADGSITVVVAAQDPGHANWLSTAGHQQGTMCWRWVKAKAHPQPQTRVVALDQAPRL